MVYEIQKPKYSSHKQKMMNALANLNITMCHAFIQSKDEMLSQVNIYLDSWKDENFQVNIIVNSDD
jgi:hypothetical protein